MERGSTYLIRRDGKKEFTISKWKDGSNDVESVYKMWITQHKFIACECPAQKNSTTCRHQQILCRWIEDGMPELKEYTYEK